MSQTFRPNTGDRATYPTRGREHQLTTMAHEMPASCLLMMGGMASPAPDQHRLQRSQHRTSKLDIISHLLAAKTPLIIGIFVPLVAFCPLVAGCWLATTVFGLGCLLEATVNPNG